MSQFARQLLAWLSCGPGRSEIIARAERGTPRELSAEDHPSSTLQLLMRHFHRTITNTKENCLGPASHGACNVRRHYASAAGLFVER
jgi:hypothetical protein